MLDTRTEVLLRTRPEILAAVLAEVDCVVIDEFQDTSRDQFELILGLTRDWQSGDGRTLFVVGDPMQSIYQFREARVDLFEAALRDGFGDVKLGLGRENAREFLRQHGAVADEIEAGIRANAKAGKVAAPAAPSAE